ncbi:FlgO family outer membrane protein [Alteromonas sp. CYL-A6]|uniref:FlgO family outer membrane protein n=1 Tax=Alteromonas nitratireducens TaxID=3390813 RepID=UPI0034BEDFFC
MTQSEAPRYWLAEDGNVHAMADEPVVPSGSGLGYQPDSRDREYEMQAQRQASQPNALNTGFSPTVTHKTLVDYAEQLAMGLMSNTRQLSADELVGVTSFVRLNRSLREPTILGNQLAEYLMGELQTFGLGVVDFKLAQNITVTSYGDLALSREASRLASKLNMDHIVTGTMVEDERGIRVNARIVSVANQQLVSSATVYIPAFIVKSLIPERVAAE